MLNWINLVLFLLIPIIINAKEITINSVESLEGASFECYKEKNRGLKLAIYAETGQELVILVPQGQYLRLTYNDIYYSTVLGSNQKLINALMLTRTAYILDGKPIDGPMIPEDEQLKTQEYYEQLKNALKEAHEKKRCLNWRL